VIWRMIRTFNLPAREFRNVSLFIGLESFALAPNLNLRDEFIFLALEQGRVVVVHLFLLDAHVLLFDHSLDLLRVVLGDVRNALASLTDKSLES
jgi:hypothetical protein